jgi:hypothetical protein
MDYKKIFIDQINHWYNKKTILDFYENENEIVYKTKNQPDIKKAKDYRITVLNYKRLYEWVSFFNQYDVELSLFLSQGVFEGDGSEIVTYKCFYFSIFNHYFDLTASYNEHLERIQTRIYWLGENKDEYTSIKPDRIPVECLNKLESLKMAFIKEIPNDFKEHRLSGLFNPDFCVFI